MIKFIGNDILVTVDGADIMAEKILDLITKYGGDRDAAVVAVAESLREVARGNADTKDWEL